MADQKPEQTTPAPVASTKTKTFTSPLGKEVIVKTILNVKEFNELKKLFYGGVSISGAAGDKNPKQQVGGDILVMVEEKLVELAVVKYGDNSKNPVEDIMNLDDREEYKAIVGSIEHLADDLFITPR